MSWSVAFFRQARSDNAVRRRLNHPDVEYSHRLQYLQMTTEKLAKGFASTSTAEQPPPPSHKAFVRLLQTLKVRPEIRRRLGYADAARFRAFIDSLLPLAEQIEDLAPSSAGQSRPNPEYPWADPVTGIIHVPAEFRFAMFDPRNTRMIKLEQLVESLIRMAE